MARRIAKARLPLTQICIYNRGIDLVTKRNSDINPGDMKILYKKIPKFILFSRRYIQLLEYLFDNTVCFSMTGKLGFYTFFVTNISWSLNIILFL